jgi:DNA-binding transcriptional MerR regulator
MSNIIDKIKELVNQEPPADPPAPPADPPPADPPQDPPPQDPPPADPPAPNVEDLLKKQAEELEKKFDEKLKSIKSDTTPPAPQNQPPAEPVKGGIDGKKWNERLENIKKNLPYN